MRKRGKRLGGRFGDGGFAFTARVRPEHDRDVAVIGEQQVAFGKDLAQERGCVAVPGLP